MYLEKKCDAHLEFFTYTIQTTSIMATKGNDLWKLDLLEAKFLHYSPRFPHTKKLLTARNPKLWKKFPASKEDAAKQILAMKTDTFHRKYHASQKKLTKVVKAKIKGDILKIEKQQIKAFIESPDRVDQLITSKLVKCVTASILVDKESKKNIPKYIPKELVTIIEDKTHPANPSKLFIDYCQNDKDVNNYISSLWNAKAVKSVLGEIDWSFRLVRGNLTKQERDVRKKSGKGLDNEEEDEEEEDEEDEEEDAQGGVEDLSKYDNMVAGSEDDEEIENDSDNESQDSFFEYDSEEEREKQRFKEKEKQYKLPELATGYFSGGSDDEDDIDNDAVVKEATTQRKNRRGQRARQKIWEKKYGKEAKHIKEERAKAATEREIRQKEYEERCRKRELKAKLAMENAPSGSNTAPLGVRGSMTTKITTPTPPPAQMHPSWEAKKLAEAKQNVKFAGKKITFD